MARFFWDRESCAWVEFDPSAPRPRPMAPMLIRDIEPYREMYSGKRISSRRQHRDFLRAHGFTEVGNEYNKGVPVDRAPESPGMSERARRDAIERAYQQVEQGGGRKAEGEM